MNNYPLDSRWLLGREVRRQVGDGPGPFDHGRVHTAHSRVCGGRKERSHSGKVSHSIYTLVLYRYGTVCNVIQWCISLLRVIEGLGEGVAMPAMQAMISKWTPLQERSFLAAIIYAGMCRHILIDWHTLCYGTGVSNELCTLGTPAGNVISLPLSGILADSVSWESVFYVFGAIGVVWFVFWIWIVADTPAKHATITKVRARLHYMTKPCDMGHTCMAVWSLLIMG